jgi:hypothetical protein
MKFPDTVLEVLTKSPSPPPHLTGPERKKEKKIKVTRHAAPCGSFLCLCCHPDLFSTLYFPLILSVVICFIFLLMHIQF